MEPFMIERKILYYPTIIVPSSWLKWAILYWDKVSSIIPSRWEFDEKKYFREPSEISDFNDMLYLKDENIFEQIAPDRHYNEFLKIFEELEKLFSSGALESPKNWRKEERYKIHVEKMNLGIFRLLEENNCISKNGDGLFEWVYVEKNAYLLYMALLAKNLASSTKDYTIPGTDRKEYENLVVGVSEPNNNLISLRSNFLDILPSPDNSVSIRKIVKFRNDYRGQLLDFREIIDSFQIDISNSKDESEIKRTTLWYKEKLERQRSKLRACLKDNDISVASSIVSSLIDIKSPALIETLGLTVAQVPLAVTIPIVAGTAAIQVGAALVSRRNEQAAKIRDSAYSYLYYAEQEKIIPKNR